MVPVRILPYQTFMIPQVSSNPFKSVCDLISSRSTAGSYMGETVQKQYRRFSTGGRNFDQSFVGDVAF